MRMKRWLTGAALVCALVLAGIAWWLGRAPAPAPPADEAVPPGAGQSAALPAGCRDESFEASAFIVCLVDLARQAVSLELTRPDGKPLEKLELARAPFVWAMNAGMYHDDFSPVGLYVEAGVERAPLNLADAGGNFFLKPNGVFFIDRTGRPGVLETSAYLRLRPAVDFATQSGPMLVIDGNVHPRFEPDGRSKHIRNGVGVDKTGRAVFAISRGQVSFGRFARLFRDKLGCDNALFLDGTASALHDGRRYVVGGQYPVGPALVVRRIQ